MQIEKLLKPRFRCIDKFPLMSMEVGDIIQFENGLGTGQMSAYSDWGGTLEKIEVYSDVDGFKEYPNLFKEMLWHEDRKEEDMPKYLKFIWNGEVDEVVKVKGWLHGNTVEEERNKKGNISGFAHASEHSSSLFPRVSINGWTPATKDEYENYLLLNNNE